MRTKNKYRVLYPREYRIWKAMRARCTAPSNKNVGNYQKNHICVCSRWNSFENFILDMGSCPEGYTIDRIDNLGNYEPSNCRWVSFATQSRNRGSFNKTYTYQGKTQCLKDWATDLGIKYITLQMRTVRHPDWSFEQLINYIPEKDEKFEYEGTLYTRSELCEKFGISKKLFYDRWHKGWDLNKIINTPKKWLKK